LCKHVPSSWAEQRVQFKFPQESIRPVQVSPSCNRSVSGN
jgi:hypothetical protein